MEKKTIGSFMSALRRAAGMTQRDLAEKLNVSDKAVSRWERDESAPDLTLLPLIADLFGITVDELLRGQRRPVAESIAVPPEANSQGEPGSEDTDAARCAVPSKRQKLLLGNSLRRFRNFNYISLGLALAGIIAALICNFGFHRAALGFFIGIAFEIGAVICTLVFAGNALPVSEEDYDASLMRDYKRSVLELAYKTLFLVALMLGPLVELAFVGAAFGAYAGMGAESFLLGCVIWLPVGGLILREISLLYIMPRVRRSFGVEDDEAQETRRVACVRLMRRCALSLVLALILPLIAYGVFTCGIFDSRTAFAEPLIFDTFEAFSAYIEQSGEDGEDATWGSRSMGYRGSKGTVAPGRGSYESNDTAVEILPDDTGWGPDESVPTEAEPYEDPDLYVIYDDGGNEVNRFHWYNTDVGMIDWDFTRSAQGTPIAVYTYEKMGNSRDTLLTISLALFWLMVLELFITVIVYCVKRRKIFRAGK